SNRPESGVPFGPCSFVCTTSKWPHDPQGRGGRLMKYMLLITQGEWFANGNQADRDKAMEGVVEWWGTQFASGKMVGGQQLQSPETATTVVIGLAASHGTVFGPFTH